MIQKKRTWLIAIAIVAAAAVVSQRGQRVKAQGSGAQGGPAVMAPAIPIIAANLPVVGAGPREPLRVRTEHPILPEAQFEALKAAAAAGGGPRLAVTLGLAPQMPSAQTPGAIVSFDGDFEGEAGCGGWVPADQALAVGDGNNLIVQVVNECLSVWTPGGARVLGPVSLQSFFGINAGVSVCDPRALFDWKNHRFIVSAIVCSSPYSASIAVSQSDNPTGGWWVYNGFGSFGSPGALMDYQRLGQDASATYPGSGFPGGIYLAYNLFNPNYVEEEWKILPKGPMYVGAGFSYWNFWGMTSNGAITDSSQPANVWSPYEHPRAEFFTTVANNGNSNLVSVFAVSNPFNWVSGGDTPELSGPAIVGAANGWTFPPNAPQLGGPNNIETLDNRISGEVTYASGFLYAAHVTGNGAGGTASELYKIQPFLNVSDARCTNALDSGLCPQVTGALIRTESVLNYGGTSAAFFPTQQPDLEGNVTTFINYATTTGYVSEVFISQRVTAGPAFFDGGFYLAQGQGVYTSGRWGDYTAVAPVGVFYAAGDGGATGNNAFVFSGMYADTTANNRWRTRVGANIFNNVSQYGPTQSQ
jgi:hypothetical protein